MPFTSQSQRKWMFLKHPAMAHRWAAHTPDIKALPEHAKKKEKTAYDIGVNAALEELGFKVADDLTYDDTQARFDDVDALNKGETRLKQNHEPRKFFGLNQLLMKKER